MLAKVFICAIEGSKEVRSRVESARALQRERFEGTSIKVNADMGPCEAWNPCQLEEAAQRLAKTAMEQLHPSARAYHRTLKLARAIRDLAGSRP